ncbi:DUF6382 domain-containing protein [Thomasclavelia cocleata]|uniref:DUF6382 domain-containing protein n=1 Tax=Thomasclavelia cocleata TaxID=69824 RepID=UPI0025755E8B|nr:DUF6382 domain-containing protein [Thomasclavelia cocleata]
MINTRNKLNVNCNFLEYEINIDDSIDFFCEGMIKNNHIKGILPISFQQVDTNRYYSFDVSGLISLDEILNNPVDKKQLINILISIIDTLEIAGEYMIEEKYFLLNINNVYVDRKSDEAYLVCLPIENTEDIMNFDEFLKYVLVMAKYVNEADTDFQIKIFNFLNRNYNCSLKDIKSLLLSLKNNYYNKPNPVPKEIKLSQPIKEIRPREVTIPAYQEILPKPSIPIYQEIPRKEQKPIAVKKNMEVETFQSKRTDGIPTLKRNKTINVDKDSIKKKKKEKSFSKNKSKKSSIPTLSKRKEAKINNDKTNRNIDLPYERNIEPGNFAGTTVLGQNDGTTVLSEGTTVLSANQANIKYATITRMINNQKMEINKMIFNIGKDEQFNDFVINDNTAVSRKHAEIHYENGKYFILDLNSTNKTIVDGTIVRPGYKLELFSGSRIKIADEDFIFEI